MRCLNFHLKMIAHYVLHTTLDGHMDFQPVLTLCTHVALGDCVALDILGVNR